MAHFALVENETVSQIIVIDNANVGYLEFPDSEPTGQSFIASLGLGGEWLQTSYNGNFRKCYPQMGYTYSAELDAFIAPKPFDEFILDDNAEWVPPIPKPDDGKVYHWENGGWAETPKPYPSWIKDAESGMWIPPIALPDNGLPHIWDEDNQAWIQYTAEQNSPE